MTEPFSRDQILIRKLTEIVLSNLQNEDFGVRELAGESGIKNYILNRKLKSIKNKSVNQFIREIRLLKARELLQEKSVTIAEIAYKTGFNSPSYFNKCFHEYFGYPPGTVKKEDLPYTGAEDLLQNSSDKPADKSVRKAYLLSPLGKILIVFLILSAGLFAYNKIQLLIGNHSLSSSDNRISLAVMPFSNMTNDTVWNIWQDGIQVSLISFFTNYPDELKVRQPATVSVLIQGSGLKNYPLFTQSDTRNISRRLDTELILTGSLLKSGDEIRINVQLFDTQKGESVKSFEIQGPAKESIVFPLVDSLKLKIRNYLLISRIKKHEPYTQYFHLAPNVSPEAYRYFVLGNMALKKTDWVTAIDLFTKALESDSTIGIQGVYSSLTSANLNLEKFKDAKAWCLKGYGKSEKMDLWVKLTTEYQYSNLFETPADAVKYAEQMISIDDKLPSGHWKLGDLYFNSQQWGKAIPEFEKVLELYESWKLKPFFIPNYSELGYAYHKNGNLKKEKKLYKQAQKDFPDDPEIMDQYAILAFTFGDTAEANRWIRKYVSKREEQLWSRARITSSLGYIYTEGGFPDLGETCYRKAVILESENPLWKHRLARFLIEKDRNIKEGIDIEDKLLSQDSDNYNYLDVYGWGLYKQKKYKKALEILERSWDLRIKNAIYNSPAFNHLAEAKIAAREPI